MNMINESISGLRVLPPTFLQRNLHITALCSALLSGWCLNGHGYVRNNRTEMFLNTDLGPALLVPPLFFIEQIQEVRADPRLCG